MTVKELIAELATLDQDLRVSMEDTGEDLLDVEDIYVAHFKIASRVILSCLRRK